MAAKRRYRLPVIEAFRRQLRYARSDVLRKQALAAESLVFEVDRERMYPSSWVVWRITGFRPENQELGDAVLNGIDLRHDLAVFMQELAGDIEFTAADRPSGAVATQEAAARLGVSVRTLQRWRDRGLPLIPIRFNDGTRKRGCFLDTLERFAASESRLVENARRFGRAASRERANIREEVGSRMREGARTTKAIAEVAHRAGRSLGTVRRAAACPSIVRRGVGEARRFGLRAHDQRVALEVIAGRLQRSDSSARRLILDARSQRVRSLLRRSVELATTNLPDADEVFAVAGVLDGFSESLAGLGIEEWLLRVRGLGEGRESDAAGSRIAAMHFLNSRARRNCEAMSARPGFKAIDVIERDLSWGGLLLERSVLGVMGVALRRFEQSVGARLEGLSSESTLQAVNLLLETCSQAILLFDPGRKSPWHELHRSVGLTVAREVASHPNWRDGIDGVDGADGFAVDTRPDSLLILPSRLRTIIGPIRWWRSGAASELDPETRTMLELRHGMGAGERPRSMRELGGTLGVSPTHLHSRVVEAERKLRRAALRIT